MTTRTCNRDRKRRLIREAKYRAKRAGVPFDLTPEDVVVPARCPALGIKLSFGGGNTYEGRANSPSLDRIDHAKGYVKGNVIVVSNLANGIRQRAEPADIALVASFYAQLTE